MDRVLVGQKFIPDFNHKLGWSFGANKNIQVILDVITNSHLKVSALDLYTNFVSEYEIKINKLSLMEVIIKAVNDIQDVKAAHEFLEKFKPKVRWNNLISFIKFHK